MGTLFPTLQLAAQAPQSGRDIPMAVAIFTFVRSLGQAFGIALGGVIFQNQFDKNIQIQVTRLPPEYVISGSQAAEFVTMLFSVPEAARLVLQYVYADSLRVLWYVMTPFAGVGLLLSFLSKDLSLNQKHDVAQPFEDKVTTEIDAVKV